MVFTLIFGPPAVGKMTVGHELAKLTGLKLFHNHMAIEPVLHFFDYGQAPFNRLVGEFRQRIFEEVASSDLPGLIFTYVWSLHQPSDKEYVDRACDIFRAKGARICFVELEAVLSERLIRNASDFRLSQKPSKRDVVLSKERLLEHERTHKFNTNGDFFYKENYIKIDNSNLSPIDAARRVVKDLSLPALSASPAV